MPLSGEGRQILSALTVNLLSCSLGANMGWVSEKQKFCCQQNDFKRFTFSNLHPVLFYCYQASSAMLFLESKYSDLTTGTLSHAGNC